MKTIYKYPIRIAQIQQVPMPTDADVLSVQFQNDQLCLWAAVDTDAVEELRDVFISGTGGEIGGTVLQHMVFLGTVQQGEFVWHVFVS